MKSFKKCFSFFILFVLCIASFYGCGSFAKPTVSHFDLNKNLIVHYIDVGQGDSILIQVNGKNMLIDSGPEGCSVVSYLKSQNIKKLDYVITTHPHEDHIGTMSHVISTFDIVKFYAPRVTTNTRVFENMVLALKKKNLKIIPAYSGITLDLGKNIDCKMLSPNSTSYEDLNNYSAAIKLTFKNTSFLFMGDAQNLSESEILNKGFDISCDVLKVGHHGSKTSTSNEFLNKASPRIAIISCGKNNDYGHPHSQTLKKLKKANCKIYRTDINGTIVIKSDGQKITVEN